MLFSRAPPDISHSGRCVQGIQKNWQFVSDLQICFHFTTQNSETALKTNGETNTFLICLFVLSEQLDRSLYIVKSKQMRVCAILKD